MDSVLLPEVGFKPFQLRILGGMADLFSGFTSKNGGVLNALVIRLFSKLASIADQEILRYTGFKTYISIVPQQDIEAQLKLVALDLNAVGKLLPFLAKGKSHIDSPETELERRILVLHEKFEALNTILLDVRQALQMLQPGYATLERLQNMTKAQHLLYTKLINERLAHFAEPEHDIEDWLIADLAPELE